jgi:hypothetical protein
MGNISDAKLHLLVETSLAMEKVNKETEYRRGFQDGKYYYKEEYGNKRYGNKNNQ